MCEEADAVSDDDAARRAAAAEEAEDEAEAELEVRVGKGGNPPPKTALAYSPEYFIPREFSNPQSLAPSPK